MERRREEKKRHRKIDRGSEMIGFVYLSQKKGKMMQHRGLSE